ncbi:MAG: hypothetical protein IT380_21225 [Myxococcales bacterium]|nr:hypothetical protein [Myxococcales bacterium]
MSCDLHQAFLLDETLPKPDGHDAHVPACERCRALKAGHLAALALKARRPRLAARVPLEAAQRRLSILVAGLLVVGGTAGLAWLRLAPGAVEAEAPEALAVDVRPAVDAEAPPLEVVARAPERGAAEEWAGLVDLRDALAKDLSRDLRDDEVLTRSFGALPAWVAPTKTFPLRRLGAAASHLSYTSED